MLCVGLNRRSAFVAHRAKHVRIESSMYPCFQNDLGMGWHSNHPAAQNNETLLSPAMVIGPIAATSKLRVVLVHNEAICEWFANSADAEGQCRDCIVDLSTGGLLHRS